MGFAPPGNGPAFHTHDYVESFLVLEGEWRFYWGNEPGQVEGEAILGKWDFISIPPGLYRGFEVSGETRRLVLRGARPARGLQQQRPVLGP